jgi:YqaJ-like viral recombinase domain
VKLLQVEQGSETWKRARLGFPTASCFHRIITAMGKPVDSKDRKKYMYRLVAENILGELMPEEWDGNEHTERGTAMEARARSALEKKLGFQIDPGGFVIDDSGRYGCSPDGLVRNKSEAVEIKCPAAWTHIGYMVNGPSWPYDRYKSQVQGQILIGGFRCVHFWSYHPNFPPVHVVTLPDDIFQRRLREFLDNFCNDLEATTEWVRRHSNAEEVVWGRE